MNRVNKCLWGIVLIGLGVIFGLNALGLTDVRIFFPGWWTLFIIVPCTIGLITENEKLGNLLGVVIGVLLLLASLDVIDFGLVWRLIVPIALVAIGFKVIFKGIIGSDKARQISSEQERERRTKIREGEVVDDKEEYWATFSGQKVSYDGKNFKGCRLEAVFGSVELDLRGAKIAKDAVVKTSSIFGGVKIIVDSDVNIEVASSSIFGGVTNDHKNSDSNKKTLYIDATCVFGGAEIK